VTGATGSTRGLQGTGGWQRWLALALAVVVAGGIWLYTRRDRAPSRQTYRIGFEENPPYHFRRPDGSVGGIAYDVVSDAARRAGLALEWVECPESSEAALRSGRVDLWPVVTDLPARRQFIYISEPWMQTDHFLIVREGEPVPGAGATGRIGHGRLRLHDQLLAQHFPRAERVRFDAHVDVVRELCAGRLAAAFLGAPQTIEALNAQPPPCTGVKLEIRAVPALRLKQGLGSTFAARPVADAIRDRIAELAREGTLAGTLIKYSFFSLDETNATYDALVAEERTRWLSWGVGLLALALAFTVWLSRSLYKARQVAEAADAAKKEFITRYATAARATSDAIWDADLTTRQVSWHEGAFTLFGYAEPDVGPDLAWRHDRIHPADRARVIASLEGALARGEQKWSEEYRFRRASGDYAHVVDRGYVIYGPSKQPVRMIGAMMDLTPLRRLEERLVQSERLEAVGRLAGGVAHDFNNLLTAILGYVSALRSGSADDPGQRAHDLEQIENAATRAADLTQQLLAFSRRQILVPEVLALDGVLAEIESLVRRLIGEHIAIAVKTVPDLGCVKADRGQLSQVVLNLCINARDAMPGGGTMLIETGNDELDDARAARVGVPPGPYVRLSVVDTGEGMDVETQRRIFEPFFTTKPAGTGTGLGLATVYGIVKQSGGGVRVTSERGRGSTFTVHLPRVACTGVVAGPRPDAAAPVTGSETVLMVEDEAGVGDVVARTLRDAGYKVLRAQDPGEALEVSRTYEGVIDIVLTDVVMPGMNGTELVEQLRPSHPEARVLYMSGYADDMTVESAFRQGHDVLLKPFTPDVLLGRVRRALDG
jgi:PAS domain S-box-containing protein